MHLRQCDQAVPCHTYFIALTETTVLTSNTPILTTEGSKFAFVFTLHKPV